MSNYDDKGSWTPPADSHINALHRKYGKAEVLQVQEPVAFPIPPAGIIAHPNLGELYDRLQMQQYAMKYAMLYTAPQPPAPCPKCRQFQDEAERLTVETAEIEAERDALQAKVAELENIPAAEVWHKRYLARCLKANDDAATRGAEIVALETRIAELELYVGNLLARIHRDGGHYQAEHGNRKSVSDADLIVAKLNAQSDEQSAEIERLKTVPMKYRRMAFNAQLQDENKQQVERIAELESFRTLAVEHANVTANEAARYQKRITEQSALIEQCEKFAADIPGNGSLLGFISESARIEVLAAIAAHKKS